MKGKKVMNNNAKIIMKEGIELLEETRNSFYEVCKPVKFNDKYYLIDLFMAYSIEMHKDHIEKIAQLEQQIAELISQNDQQILKG